LAKLNGLGFVVVEQDFQCTTTTEVADKDLLAYEQALKVLAGALELLRQRACLVEQRAMRIKRFIKSQVVLS
jgi:hypothetical protein